MQEQEKKPERGGRVFVLLLPECQTLTHHAVLPFLSLPSPPPSPPPSPAPYLHVQMGVGSFSQEVSKLALKFPDEGRAHLGEEGRECGHHTAVLG